MIAVKCGELIYRNLRIFAATASGGNNDAKK